MIKIERLIDSWGEIYINVGKCEKFEYEIQPDMPKLNERNLLDYIKRENAEKLKKHDIINIRRTISNIVGNRYKKIWRETVSN